MWISHGISKQLNQLNNIKQPAIMVHSWGLCQNFVKTYYYIASTMMGITHMLYWDDYHIIGLPIFKGNPIFM